MEGSSDAVTLSLYEMFFDIADNLCSRYTGLTPFIVRREKFGEVILLVNRINLKERRKKGAKSSDTVRRDEKGNIYIRRRATNDNWY